MTRVQHGDGATLDIDLHELVARFRALVRVRGMQLPHGEHLGAVPLQVAKAIAAVAIGDATRPVAVSRLV